MSPRIKASEFDFLNGARVADQYMFEDVLPGERIGQPLPRRPGSTMLSALLVIVILMAMGWGLLSTRHIWQGWLPDRAALAPQTPEVTTAATMPAPTIETAREISAAPGRDAGVPMAAEAEADTQQTSAGAETASIAETSDAPNADASEAAPEPLPPPQFDQKDPLQRRAVAAGLHPDLSRALLARMTKADFRNASTAIKKALAAPDMKEALVWPKAPSSKAAQFEVRFVAAAAHDCLRYVVTVIKDRWSTTAQPMEKCGNELPAAARTKSARG